MRPTFSVESPLPGPEGAERPRQPQATHTAVMMIKKIDLETLLLDEFQDVDKTSCDEDEERDKKGERHSGWILLYGCCSGELSSQTIVHWGFQSVAKR